MKIKIERRQVGRANMTIPKMVVIPNPSDDKDVLAVARLAEQARALGAPVTTSPQFGDGAWEFSMACGL